jgi:hypothetical protein
MEYSDNIFLGGMYMEKKTCFIITPIGGDGEPIRREIEGVINTVISPVVRDFGYDEPVVAHKIVTPGSINNQIIEHIVNDDLVIVNLTGLNPNVMYELAIRHATKKPVIHICQKETDLPFDIKLERTIFYTNDIMGAAELGVQLKQFIEVISTQNTWDDNPIYSGLRASLFKKTIIDTDDEMSSLTQNKYVMDQMSLILKRLDIIDAKTERTYNSGKINEGINWSKNFTIDPCNLVRAEEIVFDSSKIKPYSILNPSNYTITAQKIKDNTNYPIDGVKINVNNE